MAKQNVSGVLLVSLLSFDPLPISFLLSDVPLAEITAGFRFPYRAISSRVDRATADGPTGGPCG